MKSSNEGYYLSPERNLRILFQKPLFFTSFSCLGGSFNPRNPSNGFDFKEQSPGFFSRDLLLFKCKATIEELQNELEAIQKEKRTLEEKNQKIERENIEKNEIANREKFEKEKFERILMVFQLISHCFLVVL